MEEEEASEEKFRETGYERIRKMHGEAIFQRLQQLIEAGYRYQAERGCDGILRHPNWNFHNGGATLWADGTLELGGRSSGGEEKMLAGWITINETEKFEQFIRSVPEPTWRYKHGPSAILLLLCAVILLLAIVF